MKVSSLKLTTQKSQKIQGESEKSAVFKEKVKSRSLSLLPQMECLQSPVGSAVLARSFFLHIIFRWHFLLPFFHTMWFSHMWWGTFGCLGTNQILGSITDSKYQRICKYSTVVPLLVTHTMELKGEQTAYSKSQKPQLSACLPWCHNAQFSFCITLWIWTGFRAIGKGVLFRKGIKLQNLFHNIVLQLRLAIIL